MKKKKLTENTLVEFWKNSVKNNFALVRKWQMNRKERRQLKKKIKRVSQLLSYDFAKFSKIFDHTYDLIVWILQRLLLTEQCSGVF